MTPDQLDDFLERARQDTDAVAVPRGFTDRVMRAVHQPSAAPARFDLLTSVLRSGALVGSGAMLWLSGDSAAVMAGALLMLSGFAWTWLDDPFTADLEIRLSPW